VFYRCLSCRFFTTDFTHLPALRDLRTAKAEQHARLQAGYGTVLRRGPLADANLHLIAEEIAQIDQLIRKCETDLTSLTEDEHRRVQQWLDQRQRFAVIIPVEALTARNQRLDRPTFDPATLDAATGHQR
jgi:hypothetical protein